MDKTFEGKDYFGDHYYTPPPPPEEEKSSTQKEVEEFKGLPVRVGGDKIFLLRNGKKHWVSTAEVYKNLGFKFGDEVKIDEKTLNVIPEGEQIK